MNQFVLWFLDFSSHPPNAEPGEEAMSFPNPTETELPSAKAFVTSSIALFLE